MQGATLEKTLYSITSEKALLSKEIQVQCCLKEAQVSALGQIFFTYQKEWLTPWSYSELNFVCGIVSVKS